MKLPKSTNKLHNLYFVHYQPGNGLHAGTMHDVHSIHQEQFPIV